MNDLVKMTAREAVSALRGKQVSSSELIDAALERIAETDGAINALPTHAAERARAHAAALETPGDPPRGRGGGRLVRASRLRRRSRKASWRSRREPAQGHAQVRSWA